MQDEFYKENIKEALKNLILVNKSIYSSLIDISMQGGLKEWNKGVPLGEVHNFDFELFKNSDDTNIQLLVKIIEHVDATFHTMRNINRIEIDE